MYEHFRDFFEDVLPEFSKAGKVVQFKVRSNLLFIIIKPIWTSGREGEG